MDNQSIFRKTVLAGVGIYSLTKEKAQDVVTELVKKGELSKDEGPQFVKAIMQKADEEVEFFKKMVDKRVDRAFSRFKPSYDEEFKKLNQKIDKLSKEVEKLVSK